MAGNFPKYGRYILYTLIFLAIVGVGALITLAALEILSVLVPIITGTVLLAGAGIYIAFKPVLTNQPNSNKENIDQQKQRTATSNTIKENNVIDSKNIKEEEKNSILEECMTFLKNASFLYTKHMNRKLEQTKIKFETDCHPPYASFTITQFITSSPSTYNEKVSFSINNNGTITFDNADKTKDVAEYLCLPWTLNIVHSFLIGKKNIDCNDTRLKNELFKALGTINQNQFKKMVLLCLFPKT